MADRLGTALPTLTDGFDSRHLLYGDVMRNGSSPICKIGAKAYIRTINSSLNGDPL